MLDGIKDFARDGLRDFASYGPAQMRITFQERWDGNIDRAGPKFERGARSGRGADAGFELGLALGSAGAGALMLTAPGRGSAYRMALRSPTYQSAK